MRLVEAIELQVCGDTERAVRGRPELGLERQGSDDARCQDFKVPGGQGSSIATGNESENEVGGAVCGLA